MKILILCDLFPPAFGPRMGYLCKYMKRAGWEPVVVTEQINDNTFSFLTGEIPVTYIKYYRATGKLTRKIEWVLLFLFDFFFHYKDKKMEKVANSLLEKGGYAGILCSTYRTFPLPAAQKVATKYHLPFIADLRDIVEQYASDEYIAHSFHSFSYLDRLITRIFRHKLLKYRNKALKSADYVTTISPWHATILKKYNPHTTLIYNGYDPEIFFPERYRMEHFIITYTGRLISQATRDPRLLFEAIAKLDRAKHIQPETFRLQWYIDSTSKELIEQIAADFKIASYIDYFDYVPASEIPKILNHSAVLLQLANKTTETGPKGFMTTKLFEAMAVEKPLLCVRSDEACLEKTIKQTQSGIAARTVEEVYDFLLHYYTEWKEKGYTTIEVDRQAVEKFSRKRQAEQFMDLFTELSNTQNNG
ncbi:hypothetical protein [Parabacteroides sp. AM08-6]|uniref:hypothetical protein n=1 Tax=Parabacteroides sp. AM08-6 TaxID=2292053 RepID=UPI000EFF2F85|nr:hypothetical protein [Parabacteroides sp. AM08-6]RHJ84387.1 hypothetical protein DW103_06020 [Parabacteroides sp. AM08-6]